MRLMRAEKLAQDHQNSAKKFALLNGLVDQSKGLVKGLGLVHMERI